MTDTNLIERVAGAIFAQSFHPSDRNKETLDKYKTEWNGSWESSIEEAKAALAEIEAMGLVIVPREPSDETIDEMLEQTPWPIDAPDLYRMYQTAIKAAGENR